CDGICHFFFQAEDGIRDYKVTGVQTCALPISVWNGAGLVLTHGRRYTHILLPVPKVDSRGNVLQQKPPRASVEQQFACGAAASATERFNDVVFHCGFNLRPREYCLIWIR